MFVCLECGNVFSEDEIEYWKEDRGEHFGTPCYETLSGCPHCNGDYVKAYRCDSCGEWIDTNTYVEIGNEKYCEGCFVIKELGE